MTRPSHKDPHLTARGLRKLRALHRRLDRRCVIDGMGDHTGERFNSSLWSQHRHVRFERDERRRAALGLPSALPVLRALHGNEDLPPHVV